MKTNMTKFNEENMQNAFRNFEEIEEKLQELENGVNILKQNSILEIIKNDNGTAIKYTNGLMICYSLVVTENYLTTAYISTATWNYPARFAGAVQDIFLWANAAGTNNNAYITQCSRTSLTQATIRLKALAENNTTAYINSEGRSICVLAIGKWK